jgi:hypothetical protein
MLNKAEPSKVVENTIIKMESQPMPLETLAKIWFMLALFFNKYISSIKVLNLHTTDT